MAREHGALIRAIHADDSLWLLDDSGWLRRLPDTAKSTLDVETPGHVFDLCRVDGKPVIASHDGDQIKVHRLGSDTQRLIGSVTVTGGEMGIGLACRGKAPVLLTNRRVTVLGKAPQQLRGELPHGFRHVLYRDGPSLLVGSNQGEWGGGLARISLASGEVEAIDGVDAPVQDIAAAPNKPECVVVAIGLVHFFPSGRLTELCGNRARRLFAAPYKLLPVSRPTKPGSDPYPGVAFFALAPVKGGLLAIGIDGARRITAEGADEPEPLPQAIERGGEHIVEASSEYWLVMSGINGRGSVGGGMPIVVPR
jgi:hypothetical protein